MAAKKSSKPGAVKYFNDKKVEAFKSAANAMKAFKKNMPKAQLGEEVKKYTPWKDSVKLDVQTPTDFQRMLDAKEFYKNWPDPKVKSTRPSEEEKQYTGKSSKKGGAIKTKKKK